MKNLVLLATLALTLSFATAQDPGPSNDSSPVGQFIDYVFTETRTEPMVCPDALLDSLRGTFESADCGFYAWPYDTMVFDFDNHAEWEGNPYPSVGGVKWDIMDGVWLRSYNVNGKTVIIGFEDETGLVSMGVMN